MKEIIPIASDHAGYELKEEVKKSNIRSVGLDFFNSIK